MSGLLAINMLSKTPTAMYRRPCTLFEKKLELWKYLGVWY